VFLIALFFVLYNLRNPTKTEKRWTSWTGARKRKIKYHDSGKEVRQSTRRGLFGRSVKKTYVDKKCHRCHGMVKSDAQGLYHCCGRTFR
jgi:hypothetical protein